MKKFLFNLLMGQYDFAPDHAEMMAEMKVALALFMLATAAFVIGIFVYKKIFYSLSLASFIGCFYLCYMNANFEIVWLFVSLIGVLLLALEVLVPGIQVFGLLGGALIATGMANMLGSIELAIFTLALALLIAIIIVYIFLKKGYKVRAFEKFVLKKDINSKASADNLSLIGKEGVTTSPLRPTGRGEIDGSLYDLYSEADFIPANTRIVVVGDRDNKIIVRRK